jgi:hypothetical protein
MFVKEGFSDNMRWQAIVLFSCALLAGIYLADRAGSLRYMFPGGSIGRGFFFNIWIEATALIATVPALYAYYSAFKIWNTAEKAFYAFLAMVPSINLLWFILDVTIFVRTD